MHDIEFAFADMAVAAGQPIMEIYAAGIDPAAKADGSPVTEADMRAEDLILERLAQLYPSIPVIAEERMAAGQKAALGETFILVDPLDGTKEFIHRRDEFTVNIALIEKGRPIAGAIYAPALERLWIGGRQGAFTLAIAPGAAWSAQPRIMAERMEPIHTRAWPHEHAIGVASRSHADAETDAYLTRFHVQERRSQGSSLKFCLVASGQADLYPRFSPTMEWDIAAGDAILTAAGGCVLTPEGALFPYGKMDHTFRNGAFIAWGDRAHAASVYK